MNRIYKIGPIISAKSISEVKLCIKRQKSKTSYIFKLNNNNKLDGSTVLKIQVHSCDWKNLAMLNFSLLHIFRKKTFTKKNNVLFSAFTNQCINIFHLSLIIMNLEWKKCGLAQLNVRNCHVKD